MTWNPFRRPAPLEIAVTIELGKKTRLAIRRHAQAIEFAARVAGGIIHVKEKETVPVDPDWSAWELSHPDIEESEKLHMRWCRDVLSGKEKVTDEKRLEAMNLWAAAQDAGYEMPEPKA